MTEHEEAIEYLLGVGYTRPEAELVLFDDDLWIIDEGTRPGFKVDEAVREYSKAACNLDNLMHVFQPIHGATWILLADARDRASELAYRAEPRLKGAEAE
jgi:hypothetical protein